MSDSFFKGINPELIEFWLDFKKIGGKFNFW